MQMLNNNLICEPKSYKKEFFEVELKQIELMLREQAVKDGFLLIKPTGGKLIRFILNVAEVGSHVHRQAQAKDLKSLKESVKMMIVCVNILECPFKLAYIRASTTDKFTLNIHHCALTHNHEKDPNLHKNYIDERVRYIKEESKKKKISTTIFVEKIKDKFNIDKAYQAVANAHRSCDLDFFGDPAEDAENLRIILSKLKSKHSDFLGEYLSDDKTGKLTALVYATPYMKRLAENYLDLAVMDTTFGTNRFHMKHWTLCGKDRNNRTIIFAEGLITQETKELFIWLLEKIKTYFCIIPKFILIDSDPALISAVESVFPLTNLKLCGWHTENNIKNHLYGSKKSKIIYSSYLLFLILRKLLMKRPHRMFINLLKIYLTFLPYRNLIGYMVYSSKISQKLRRIILIDCSLSSHCTGMVENINKLLKQHVSLKCSLVEYVYRTIKFTSKFNDNENFTREDLDSFNSFYSHLQGSPCVVQIQGKVSRYALKVIVLNLIKSMCWASNVNKPLEIVSSKDSRIKYTLQTNQDNFLKCPCTSFVSLGLPCAHILRALTEQKKETEVLKYVRERWLELIDDAIPDNIAEELKVIMESDKKKNYNNAFEASQEERRDNNLIDSENRNNERGNVQQLRDQRGFDPFNLAGEERKVNSLSDSEDISDDRENPQSPRGIRDPDLLDMAHKQRSTGLYDSDQIINNTGNILLGDQRDLELLNLDRKEIKASLINIQEFSKDRGNLQRQRSEKSPEHLDGDKHKVGAQLVPGKSLLNPDIHASKGRPPEVKRIKNLSEQISESAKKKKKVMKNFPKPLNQTTTSD